MEIVLGEIQLTELRARPELWQAFLAVQAPWLQAGVTRWLDLVRAEGPWPAFVIAARRPERPEHLLGTIVGIWAQTPVERFDDLLEKRCPLGYVGADRPSDGVWHFIAATAAPDAEGLGLGRKLVGAALEWLDHFAPQAQARTLSPAVGLPALLAALGDPRAIPEAVMHLANAEGQPALEILRLHLGAGATLDAILPASRRDEVRSAGVTLRFAYARDPTALAAQKLRYRAWLARRAAAIAAGEGRPVADSGRWQVDDLADADVLGPSLATHDVTAR